MVLAGNKSSNYLSEIKTQKIWWMRGKNVDHLRRDPPSFFIFFIGFSVKIYFFKLILFFFDLSKICP